MHIVVTTQPEPIVSLDEAKVALGESGSDRDELVAGLILAAQAELDGPKGWVGISVARQTVEGRFGGFSGRLDLPAGPIIEPVTVTYLDSDGIAQVLDETVYVLLSAGRLALAPNQSWPATYASSEAVTVAYDVGIEDEADPRISLMKVAILSHVKMTLDHDDTEARREAIEHLVQPLRPSSGF